jgi:hypothetical protein
MRASGLACSAPGAVGSQYRPIARPVAGSQNTLRQRHITRAGMLNFSISIVAQQVLSLTSTS